MSLSLSARRRQRREGKQTEEQHRAGIERSAAPLAKPAIPPPLSLSSPLHAHVLRLPPGADLFPALAAWLHQQQAQAACILAAVGSLTKACLRYANVPSESAAVLPPAGVLTTYEVVSLCGTVSIHGCHIHMTISDQQGACLGGHVMPNGNIVHTTLELVLGVLPDLAFVREPCALSGWPELVVQRVKAGTEAGKRKAREALADDEEEQGRDVAATGARTGKSNNYKRQKAAVGTKAGSGSNQLPRESKQIVHVNGQ